jgi:hypothetical protein
MLPRSPFVGPLQERLPSPSRIEGGTFRELVYPARQWVDLQNQPRVRDLKNEGEIHENEGETHENQGEAHENQGEAHEAEQDDRTHW